MYAEFEFSSDLFFHSETPSFLITYSLMGYVGGSPRILKSTDSLEGLTELRIAVMLIMMVSDSERVQIKISKHKRHLGQSLGERAVCFQ